MREIAEALKAHVGDPSIPEAMLIEVTAFLWLQINMLAPKVLDGTAGDSDMADRQILAYTNSLRRNLETLGITKPKTQVPSLAKYIEAKADG